MVSIAGSPLAWVLRIALAARQTRQADVVHVHGGEALLLALAMKIMRVRTPILATYHSSYAGIASALRPFRLDGRTIRGTWRTWWYRQATARLHRITDRLMLRLAARVSFVCRNSAMDILGPERGPDGEVIYNGVQSPEETPSCSTPSPVELLFVGNATLLKRAHVLPFVLRRLRERVPGVRLRLVGIDPEQASRIRGLFEELGQLDAVEWMGPVSTDRMHSMYRAARVLLVPSAYEGLPMVILEAGAAGVPCVATAVGGIPEVVADGTNGWLVPSDDAAAMADRCTALLTDRGARERFGDAARDHVRERFAVGDQVERYLAAYLELAERANASAA